MAKTWVVMINWNRADFVARSARAVAQSLPPDSRFLIWDNGSDDASLVPIYNELHEDGIDTYRYPTNPGLDPAQNIILKQFFADKECESIIMLEDGCLVLPDTLTKMTEVLNSDFPGGRIGIVGCALTAGPPCQTYPLDLIEPGWVDTKVQHPDADNPWNRELLAKMPTSNPLLWNTIEAPDPFLWALTRETYEATGPLDEAFWMGWGTLNDYCHRAPGRRQTRPSVNRGWQPAVSGYRRPGEKAIPKTVGR